MSINKKVKKAGEAISSAADKLIKLVSKKAPKKKILKQVDKVQQLGKKEKKLKKKVSSSAPKTKSKANQKKAKSPKKLLAKKIAASSKKLDEKLHKNRSSIAKTKERGIPTQKQDSLKPTKSATKSKTEAAEAPKKRTEAGTPVKSKATATKTTATKAAKSKTGAATKSKSEATKATISTEMNAREAIYKITELGTLQQLEDFLKGEKRKTVLERADARKNALTDQK